ncbi:vitronectin a [Phycodurus eques]|uniref:vitronectin a n=1 Tax=Phycodurus eques TaxID=693459 RepID=UPI002ACE527F|nr:vitronectin a [Phycodurus eques]XP_061537352.1 vitronectin a [Phycodurus eques]
MLPMIGTIRFIVSVSFSHCRGNMRLWAVLFLALVTQILAADESCMGRCENGFDSEKKCQCDSMCKYYKSCCVDFEATCGMMTRGDTFDLAEDDEDYRESATTSAREPPSISPTLLTVPDFSHRPNWRPEATLEMNKPPPRSPRVTVPPSVKHPSSTNVSVALAQTTTPPTTPATTPGTTAAPDPDAEVCSGRPFDSFMQLKNGSIFAFRGEYFFELDQKTVLPGYPKLIKDVWGISGPIDAAFTRVNCHGKTYIFKGNKYWRFDNGVLDEDYPRDISVGFDNIPNHVDAAFALPAHTHDSREKVYFFKANQYYVYEFLHQPSHEECVTISKRSPSTLFRRYTNMYSSNYDRFFTDLFSEMPQHHSHHHFIDKDWKGFKSPVDAVMAGRLYVPPRRLRPQQTWGRYQQYQQYRQQYGQQYGQRWGRRRQNRSPFSESIAERGMGMGQQFAERGMDMGLRLAEKRMEMEERLGRDWSRRWGQDWDQDRMGRDWSRRWDQDWDQDRRRDGYRQNNRGNYDSRYRNDRPYWRSMPVQSIYFFRGDKYHRVDLSTKRVDPAIPPYPRSIAKYWLGCSDTAGAEKK